MSDQPILSSLDNNKNECNIGECLCTYYWQDPFNENAFSWFGGYDCNCYKDGGSTPCNFCDPPSRTGNYPDEVVQMPCYS